jgi:hypothetical protein
MFKLFTFLLILSLSACATPTWNKSGASTKDFARDSYECERDARMLPCNDLMGIAVQRSMFNRCMQSKGWVKE